MDILLTGLNWIKFNIIFASVHKTRQKRNYYFIEQSAY